MLSKVCFILDLNLHGVSTGRYQMVSVERTHLQLRLCESSAARKGITISSGASSDSWTIKHSHYSLTAAGQPSHSVLQWKKNQTNQSVFPSLILESTARHSTPSLILSMGKTENRLKSRVHTINVCCSWGLGLLVTFEQWSCIWVRDILEIEPPSPFLFMRTIQRDKEIQTLPPQPYTLTALWHSRSCRWSL